MSDSPFPPPPRRANSGTFVTISADRLPNAVVDLVDWKSKTEDWKGRKSQQVAALEGRGDIGAPAQLDAEKEIDRVRSDFALQIAQLEKSQQKDALERAIYANQLDNRFASLEQKIAVYDAKVRSSLSTLFIAFTILVGVAGLAVKFL